MKNGIHAHIILYDEYIPENEVSEVFRKSDVILAIYDKSHVGSNGILVWAAGAQKPVIGTKYGMIGEIVKKNQFGLTVDPEDPKDIAKKITTMIKDNDILWNCTNMELFSEQNTSETFANTILTNLE